MKQYVVFSDLDATLLDHNTYSYKEAVPMLEYLKKARIPLVLATSKTKAEALKYVEALQCYGPLIVENGAGVFDVQKNQEPKVVYEHVNYAQTREFFKVLQKEYAIQGFGDMSVTQIAECTALKPQDAYNAKMRDFTEPFLMDYEDRRFEMQKKARKAGFDIIKGGRFYHLIALGQDKAVAAKRVISYMQEKNAIQPFTVALGDGHNDIQMITQANKGIIIPHADGAHIHIDKPHVSVAPYVGPKGWNQALKELFL